MVVARLVNGEGLVMAFPLPRLERALVAPLLPIPIVAAPRHADDHLIVTTCRIHSTGRPDGADKGQGKEQREQRHFGDGVLGRKSLLLKESRVAVRWIPR